MGSINAITLRSGTKLNEVGLEPTSLSKEPHNEEMGEEVEVVGDEEENIARSEEELLKVKEPKRKNPLEVPTPIPFPTLAKKAKKHEDLDPNMVGIFKNVEVNISLFQAIQQVPKYAKFLKDVCTHKDKIGKLNKSPKLNLSPLKRSGARFVLADKSIVTVVGIAKNVLVNIQGSLFPIDFYILETPPIDSDKPSSILIGRPFLKMSRFKFDAFLGAYSFEADKKVVKLTLDGSKKLTLEVYSIFGCDLIEDQVVEPTKEHDEENIVKEPNSLDHTQPKHAKELEIFLLGEIPNDQ
ncbi:uncharacterized protein LOC130979516 [Arachis stenosperma]|uniref:uncharacterized protein LOC130979516 n=1 Tax=Arachis stenosperma TaxID=217475 RepID=UPI0025AD87B8|nr:uncharacterized protein LOC130979516 [Arachis stenosperma]